MSTGYPLRTFGLVIAFLGMLLFSVGAIALILVMALHESPEFEYMENVRTHPYYFWGFLPCLLLGFLASVLLLYGIYKNRAGYLLLWLILFAICFICHFVAMCYQVFLWITNSVEPYGDAYSLILMIAINGTIWFGIYLLYRQIKRENAWEECYIQSQCTCPCT